MHLFRFLSLSSAIVLANSILPAAARAAQPLAARMACEPNIACGSYEVGMPACGTCNNPPIGAFGCSQGGGNPGFMTYAWQPMDILGGVDEYNAQATLCPPGQQCTISTDAGMPVPTCVPIPE